MALNIECESRIMLTESQYNEILSAHTKNNPNAKFIEQINYYIDSPTFALRNANHKSLRIREIIEEKLELTLKIKGIDGDKEYNEDIDVNIKAQFEEQGIFPEGEIKNILIDSGFDIKSLKILTSLYTKRYEEKIDDYLVVIDINKYNGMIDYNMEIEAPSMEKAYEVMHQYCLKYNLKYNEKYDTKAKRALKSMFTK